MERFDLGAYSRAVSTRSPEAQWWFDIGLNWCYGFNHEEAIRCFEKVLSFDPGCAMAHWGIAYAAGPFYNLTWREHGPAEAEKAARRGYDHVRLARQAASGASPTERRLIEALAARYQKPHAVTETEFGQWDDAYAAEMRRVHYEFPHDQDVMALFVEALMMRTVRRLWNLKTEPLRPAPMSWRRWESVSGGSPSRTRPAPRPIPRSCTYTFICLRCRLCRNAHCGRRTGSAGCARMPGT
jgi:hypothetical protein